MSVRLLLPALAGLQLLVASTVQAADPENGQRLAERWCGGCHTISSNHKPAMTTEAPPFSLIARNPDFDARAVALFLLHPHPRMPDIGLSRDAAADLAAFISMQR